MKILDFGVSKPPIASDLTREGQIVGTPQYLAPEQVDGKAVPQTDQYAIGVMLYACLTKSLPYQNHASLGLLRAIVLGKFPPPRALRPELPEKLEEIILRAMRTAPEERFESVHALGRELLPFASAHAREQVAVVLPRRPPEGAAQGVDARDAADRGDGARDVAGDAVRAIRRASRRRRLAEPIITPTADHAGVPIGGGSGIGGRPARRASRTSPTASRVDREDDRARSAGRSGR